MKKQTIITILVVLVVILIAALGYMHYVRKTAAPVDGTVPVVTTPAANEPITITEQAISKQNYTGTKPIIAGNSVLAIAARKYVEESIADFEKNANEEVPERRKEYGVGEPATNFGIDMGASTIEGTSTQSIVIDSYIYTGGANGTSMYKVFTATKDGRILSIKDVVRPEMQQAFVVKVKKELEAYRPDGIREQVLFPEDVAKLTIDSFSNFSIAEKNMTIYFDKYEIGPGAIGAVAFPIELTKLQSYLTVK